MTAVPTATAATPSIFVVNKRWGDKYRVFAGIDNVFNKEISELSYYGRLWRVGAEMKF